MSFSKEPAIRHAQREHRLVVVLLLQEAFGVFRLDDDLLDRVIVQAEGHHMAVGPLVVGGIMVKDVAVVIVVTTKEIEFLAVDALDRVEDVVSHFSATGEGGVADDRVFDTVDLYLQGVYSREQALDQLRWKEPNFQTCIMTQKVLDNSLRFLESIDL